MHLLLLESSFTWYWQRKYLSRDLVNTKHAYLAVSGFNEKVRSKPSKSGHHEEEGKTAEIIVTPTINDNIAYPKTTKKA